MYAAALQEGAKDITQLPLNQGAAVVIGNEGRDCRRRLSPYCDSAVIIPMAGAGGVSQCLGGGEHCRLGRWPGPRARERGIPWKKRFVDVVPAGVWRGYPPGGEVLSRVGHPRKLYEMDRINLARLGIFSQKELSLLGNTTLDQARKNAAEARQLGFEILTPEDLKYPNLLKNIYSLPLVLYVGRELPDLSQQFAHRYGWAPADYRIWQKRVGRTLSGDLARGRGRWWSTDLQSALTPSATQGAIAAAERQSLCWAVVSCGLPPAEQRPSPAHLPKQGSHQ